METEIVSMGKQIVEVDAYELYENGKFVVIRVINSNIEKD